MVDLVSIFFSNRWFSSFIPPNHLASWRLIYSSFTLRSFFTLVVSFFVLLSSFSINFFASSFVHWTKTFPSKVKSCPLMITMPPLMPFSCWGKIRETGWTKCKTNKETGIALGSLDVDRPQLRKRQKICMRN